MELNETAEKAYQSAMRIYESPVGQDNMLRRPQREDFERVSLTPDLEPIQSDVRLGDFTEEQPLEPAAAGVLERMLSDPLHFRARSRRS